MYKRKEATGLFLILTILAVLISSCGGGTAAPAGLQDGLAQQPAAAVTDTALENLDGTSSGITGLPALPEGTEPLKGSSAAGGDGVPSVRGNDYINAANATETDRGLLLQPEGFGLAWALYGIGGLGDCDVVGLDVQASPLEGGSGYFVAVGNYSNRSWMISPLQDGPARIRLPEDASYISPDGHLYFVVFTVDPAGALMQGASVILDRETDRPMRRPHAPWGLEASDGTVRGGIALHWNAPRRGHVAGYVVFRKLHRDAAGDDQRLPVGWEAIGRTAETRFFDDNCRPGTHYLYSVVAKNETGRSAHSNVDGGWWGERDNDSGLFIAGRATTVDGRGVPGIFVRLDGTDRRPVLTNDEGFFVFRNLHSGLYMVHAWADNARLVVRPEIQEVRLGDEPVRGVHFIVKRVGDTVDGDPILD